MDALTRQWCPADPVIRIQHLASAFLRGRGAEDWAYALEKATEDIMEAKLLQVSMNGPKMLRQMDRT